MIMRPTVERVVTLNDLVDSIPEEIVLQYQAGAEDIPSSENTDMASSKNISKSQRIRDYLESHPNAKGKDILSALSQYGVKQSDIGNVKSKMKKDGVAPAKPTPAAPKPAAASAVSPFGISFKALESGTVFLKEAGSLTNAKELLTIIDQIRSA